MTTIEQPEDVILEQGQYWRAVEAIPDQAITKDMVLLLQSIRDVDKKAHTIVLRAHPSHYNRYVTVTERDADNKVHRISRTLHEHRFLVADFLRLFVQEYDFERIRQLEVMKIQGRIGELQEELANAETNVPASLAKQLSDGATKWEKSKDLPEGTAATLPSTAMVPLSTSITPEQITGMKLAVEHKFEMATLKATWIKEKVEEIAETVKAMTPFFSERAAAALAKTEDVQRYVRKLETSIQSLDLYVGNGVYVIDVAKGASAPMDVPLTILQRKLYADEETSVFADVEDTWDFRSKEIFIQKLASEPGLVRQIFPTERCIIAFAMRHSIKEYGSPIVDDIMNARNREVGLLVRDGENIFMVHSPIDSHLTAARLFPSRAELDDIFRDKSFFNRKKGREINFQDTLYTDKLSEHEAMSLHYKRFLIMMAGLDHRVNLFGTFYPGEKTMDFVSLNFQQQYLQFIHDDDGEKMLPEVSKPTLAEYIRKNNAYLRSGSRVFGRWTGVMTSRTAPGAVRNEGKHDYMAYKPDVESDVRIARRDAKEIVVDIPVNGYSYSIHGEREFEARVSLSKVDPDDAINFLVLDAIKAKDLESYIYDRGARQDHLSYIQFFKKTVAILKAEALEEHESREKMRRAIMQAGVTDEAQAEDLVDRAVIAWRASNSGAKLPKFESGTDKTWTSLLDQMYGLYKGENVIAQAEKYASDKGYEPLRFVIDASARYILYCAPKVEEMDNRVLEQTEVHRVTFKQTKSGISEVRSVWAEVPKNAASESIVFEWEGAALWATRKAPIGHERKQEFFRDIEAIWKDMPLMFRDSVTWLEWEGLCEDYLHVLKQRSMTNKSQVQNPAFFMPIGMAVATRYRNDEQVTYLKIIGIGNEDPEVLLYNLATDEQQRQRLQDAYVNRYRSKTTQLGYFKERCEREKASKKKFRICEIEMTPRGVTKEYAHQYLGGQANFYEEEVASLAEIGEQLKKRAADRSQRSTTSVVYVAPSMGALVGLGSTDELSWKRCENCKIIYESVKKRPNLSAPRKFQWQKTLCEECYSEHEEKYPKRAEEERTPYIPEVESDD